MRTVQANLPVLAVDVGLQGEIDGLRAAVAPRLAAEVEELPLVHWRYFWQRYKAVALWALEGALPLCERLDQRFTYSLPHYATLIAVTVLSLLSPVVLNVMWPSVRVVSLTDMRMFAAGDAKYPERLHEMA